MFTIVRFDKQPIFMIVKKDSLHKNMFKSLPIEIYGFIYINGTNYTTSTVSYRYIASCLTVENRELLAYNAKLEVFSGKHQ